MRHYLLNERKIGRRLKADIVLAETANQLYRDTAYKDLITFEEDIPRFLRWCLSLLKVLGL